MRYREIIAEAATPVQWLFHGTTIDKAISILVANTIRSDDHHPGFEAGVSLSRSLSTALGFGDVVFVFDRAALATRNRLEDKRWRPMHGEADPGDEFETYAFGNITDVEDLIVSITMWEDRAKEILQPRWGRPPSAKERKRLSTLLGNPKFNAVPIATLFRQKPR